jgi:hypothetical protein
MLTDRQVEMIEDAFGPVKRIGDQIEIPCHTAYSHPNEVERPLYEAIRIEAALERLGFEVVDGQMDEVDKFVVTLRALPPPMDVDF